MNSRHRPLHTCGVSILTIADNAIEKTQHINGPIGSTLRWVTNLAKFATPFIYAMQIQWLTILSLMDDAILAIERFIEKLFPPSIRVFKKLDEFVLMIVFLPEKFDGAVNKFPSIIHQVPYLDWALTLVVSRLNRLVSMLNRWGHENSRGNERTIGVDGSFNEGCLDTFPTMLSECEHKTVHDIAVSSQVKGSYKEALERGKEETTDEKMEKECEIDEN